jgi:hypothetical protein
MKTLALKSAKLASAPRRTPAELDAVRVAIVAVLQLTHPMTLRSLFYQLVNRYVLPKVETAYKNLGRMLCKLRELGVVPWEWVVDNTRSLSVPNTFDSIGDALRTIVHIYRRDPWMDQGSLVFVLTEKDGVASILGRVTRPYCVPIGVVHGFSSHTFLHDIAVQIEESGKPGHILYFGDHDPAGVAASRWAEEKLHQFAPNAEIHFERLAVNIGQIAEYNLPTRPTKKSDKRHKNFIGESVEVDAMPTDALYTLAQGAIERRIDWGIYGGTMDRERRERQELTDLVERYSNSEPDDDDGDDDAE